MSDPLESLLIDLGDVARSELGRLIEDAEPYPWRVVEDEEDGGYVVVTAQGDPVAQVPGDGYGKAHAKLIALAPVLALRVWNGTSTTEEGREDGRS